ncbi:hypothetical protein NLG97_g2579 [Lecanicillium saksenae]|uniref:Uncharacterized protein n=1 Tax=Lecanicillium saksenae TaxID=468837 RepID=A0ACC1R1S5_9HYPO|nr:hypothetical protein NLG97_g2579 [Lecanicillium saksenae]
MMASFPDNVFGPKLVDQFDFTLFFEQSIFAIVPDVFVILATPFYVWLASKPARVRPGLLLWLKMTAGLALLTVDAAILALWTKISTFHSDLSLPAASISLIASFCILGILYTADTCSIRPSSFLSIYLGVTLLLDIVITRSYFRRDGLHSIGYLYIVVVVLKLLLVTFEEVSKRSRFCSEPLRLSASKESTSGFWNRAVFGWLNPFLIFGFRTDLKVEHLPAIDEDLQCLQQYDRFRPQWKQINKSSKFALPKALLRTVAWDAAKILLPRLVFVGLTVSQPFLLFSVVRAVNGGLGPEEARSLILATAIIFVGKARLSIEELEQSAAITLMTTGTYAVEQMLELLYDVVSCAIQVALGVWALNLYIGPVCFLMFIPGIVSFVASHYIGSAAVTTRAAWNLEMESRVAATSNVLAQIKNIKAMGLSTMITEHLQDKRRHEVKVSLKERNTRIWLWGFHSLGRVLPPLIVLAGANFWTRASNPLDVAEVFTVVSISIIAAEPFQTLLASFVQWASGLASIRRIQDFLCLEELQDTRFTTEIPWEEFDIVPGEKRQLVSSKASPTSTAVRFESVTVMSPVTGPILKEVSISIPWGKLAILWGPIASGKSTLLRCVLGETKLGSGTVSVGTKSIGYCNQQSWIRNRTLRENITGVLEYVEVWYWEVVVACRLDVDISTMAHGDQVVTGTGGCNLSGGQKQRVSLARSVYEQKDILVIDDVFSALDPETSRQIFRNLFGPGGLVRRWGCTVIMTTNQLEFLDGADLVFQLQKGGHVEQQPVGAPPGTAGPSLESDDEKNETEINNTKIQNENPDRNREMEGESGVEPSAAEPKTELPLVKPSTKDFDLDNARAMKHHGDWSLYGYYLGAAGALIVIFWVGFVIICTVAAELPIIFIKIWYGKDPNNTSYFYGYVGLSVATIALHTLNGVIFFYQVLPKCSEEMHLRLAKTTMFASPQYLSQTDVGQLLNRFGQDVFLTSQYLPIVMTQTFYTFFSALVEIGIIASGSKYTAPIMIFLALVIYALQFFYLRTSRQLRLLELESAADLYTHYSETSSGIHLIRSFQWQQKFLMQLSTLLDRSQRPYYTLFCCQRWLSTGLDFTAAAAALVLVSVCVLLPDEVSAGGVALALINIISFNESASFLVVSWTNLETGLGAVARIKRFCAETPCEQDDLSGASAADEHRANSGRLNFDGVTTTYQMDDGSVQKALDNVTFTVLPGTKVAISGRTGCGKSSMLMTLLRMTEFTGTVRIGGQDSRTISREVLRSRITTLTQDGVELKGSVRFNLYPFLGTQPEEDLITSTLQSVGIWDHISQHGGIDKNLSSMEFSVSQKQLLFLARGILHQKTLNTKIVIMDEATSAMDNQIDDTLQELLDKTFAGCTILQIAHRADTFRNIGLQIRLEHGQLVSVPRNEPA